MSNKSVFGIVRSQSSAEHLVNELCASGFTTSEISVLFPSKGETRDFAHQQGTKAPEGALAGAGAGGALGGTLGLLAGLGLLAIPGLGQLIAAGPIMAALSGIAVGAAVGSIAGALVGMGMPEVQAKQYEGKIRSGNVLVSVHAEDGQRIHLAKSCFERNGAEDVSVVMESKVPRAETTGATPRA
jgi:hypothetical protein